ncbi:MAG: nuclear transport factor 2 family protein [Candidatus Bathyarchaeota archaeon]|jgi:ketosteroid isomerase-like protein
MDEFDVMMVVLRFNERINARDLKGLVAMMTDDHFFIDSKGERDDDMEEGWRGFFANYPDYRNVFTHVQVEGDFVAIAGHSTCSYDPLDGPALWSARVRDRKVSEWRVYKDTPKNRRKIGLT